MPILFVVKGSRRRLFAALRRLVARPGLVGVILERRQPPRRGRKGPTDRADQPGRSLRQPLDRDGLRTWAQIGFTVVKVRALPEAPDARRNAPAAPAASRPARRPASARRPR
jgi:hypothetical protein